MTNTLISDFRDLKSITYKDYTALKGYTLLQLENIEDNKIKKVLNTLSINNKTFNLDNKSVNDFIDILFIELPDLDVNFYEDHPESFLNSSALFLADFNTHLTVKFYITDEVINSNLIATYKDSEVNNYLLKNLKVFNEFNEELPYYKRESSYRMTLKDRRLTLVCSYDASDLKLMFLQEYPISSLNQISNMSEDRSLALWS